MSLLLALTGSGGGYTVTANTGTYAVTGSPANLLRGYVLTAASGSYALTGQSANIVYTPSGGVYTLTAASGSYAVSGSNATIRFTSGTQVIHGPNNQRKQHKEPTYQDYLKSTEKEDREYLDKVYKIDEPTLEVLKKEAKTLVQIENIYHNAEHDREKLRQSLIDEGIAYRDAYLEVYTGLVNEYRQAEEDDAIAAVIAAIL
jgi:hypothetical protein